MNEEDNCFGEFPFDNECDRTTCMFECEDVLKCKRVTKERKT